MLLCLALNIQEGKGCKTLTTKKLYGEYTHAVDHGSPSDLSWHLLDGFDLNPRYMDDLDCDAPYMMGYWDPRQG